MSDSSSADFDPLGDLPAGRTLLQASAGTGKTHTITSLVLRMIAEGGYTMSALLIVTFTRAAAAELRDRVRTRLASAALAVEHAADAERRGEVPGGDPDAIVDALIAGAAGRDGVLAERARLLREASEQLDDATITTIHGFCQRILTLCALETGVDFDAELVEDERTLVGEVADDLTDRRLRHATPEWYAYLRNVAGVDHAEIEDVAAKAVAGARPRLLPSPDGESGADPLAAWRDACERFAEVWHACRDDLDGQLRPLTGKGGSLKRWQRSNGVDPVASTTARLDEWFASGPPSMPSETSWQKDCGIAWLLERFKGGRQRGVHPLLDAALDVVEALMTPADRLLSTLAAEACWELDARKRRTQVIAYDDQLRRLADALGDPARRDAVVTAIRGRYDAALIDEFQDTDPLQWQIFSAAFADAPLVLIGDPKQAIYGFRGADLPTYLRAAATVPGGATFSLPVNWRSDQRYVDAVNALFTEPGAFAVAGIDAPVVRAVDDHRHDRLRWPDGHPRAALRLRYVTRDAAEPQGGVSGQSISKWWADRHLPVDVAGQVRALLAEQPHLDSRDGPLQPGDIAVLVRTNRQARLTHQRLMDADIPATLTRAGSVFATAEADELVRLLEALAEPGRAPLARAAAAGRMFAWQARDLLDPAGQAEWDRWLESLREWERRWRERGIMAALRTVFADESVWPRLLATEGGERAIANLWHLAERLHAVEQSERLGPAALLGWLRDARDEADDDAARASEDAELRLERDDDAVQVVTVHASKGLQYPVVLCPFLWDGVLLRPGEKKVLRFHDTDHDDQLTLDLHRDTASEPKATHVDMAQRQRHAESLRLAYVALTRAEHLAVVWWGAFRDASTSPLAGLLHRIPPADPYEAGQAALARADDALRGDLDALAESSGGAIGVEALTEAPALPSAWTPSEPDQPGELTAATFDRDLDRAWRRTSFTAITRSATAHGPPSTTADDADPGDMGREDDEADDVDLADAARRDHEEVDPSGPTLALADLPRGPEFGDTVHHILEDTDFTVASPAPGGLAEAVQRRTARSSVLGDAERDALVDGLAATLATPLGSALGDARLDGLARTDRCDELAFELPLAGGTAPAGAVTLHRLGACLRAHDDGQAAADALDALGGGHAVRGFLTGSVDLLARLHVDGRPRYVVIDYKTTWLGDRGQGRGAARTPDRATRWHYRPEALEAAMRLHAYHLQALLYLVAVHRYLRSRLHGAYDADRDLGGAAYLFVRGMAGPASRRDDGRTDGVWTWQPSAALVDDVSDVLATGNAVRS